MGFNYKLLDNAVRNIWHRLVIFISGREAINIRL